MKPEQSSGSTCSPTHPTPEAMAKTGKRHLKFLEYNDGGQGNKKKIEEAVPRAQDEQPFLHLSAYPFLKKPLKLVGFVKESIANVIECSKLNELEEQMQFSLKLSDLILEVWKLFSTGTINASSAKPKGSTG